jgi:hypothetical protein
MAKVNLAGMNVEALLSLRTQIDERLLELRTELTKQLAALDGQPVCRQSISDSWLGNLRECLAHLV